MSECDIELLCKRKKCGLLTFIYSLITVYKRKCQQIYISLLKKIVSECDNFYVSGGRKIIGVIDSYWSKFLGVQTKMAKFDKFCQCVTFL